MELVGTKAWLRPACAEDEGFLFDVFSTTWQQSVAAMPNRDLIRHVLRIQYTSQNRRFSARFPGHERWVVMLGDEPVGRLYLHRSTPVVHIIDISVLPEFRSRGIGQAVVRGILDSARERQESVTLRVPRPNQQARRLYERLGFRLVTMDDLDAYFEWSPQAD